ncbi:MAG: phosphate ABC transporter ATP-binding protein [Sedimentisphaerales bacterium]|nr:phosphate ABC transporter ATP-binding protein [Sedimentisphaerales bacterium]
MMSDNAKIIVDKFSAFYNQAEVLRQIELSIYSKERLAIIGPANSGKSTFLRSLNRLNDLHFHFSHSGKIIFDEKDIYDNTVDVPSLRRRIGMVYAVPAPLPCSIYDNVAYGPKVSGIKSRSKLDELVEFGLKKAVLWDEVKDRLKEPAMNLSGGQQQRMCLARVLALQPEVLLLDEPCSGLDPISTAKIEDAMLELKSSYAVVLVTNNTKQAARASDRTAFFLMGQLIELSRTDELFTNPADERTEAYITGQFG